MNISFVLNGRAVALDAAPDQRAVDLLRGLALFARKKRRTA